MSSILIRATIFTRWLGIFIVGALLVACGPGTDQSFFKDKNGNDCVYITTYSGMYNGIYCKVDVEGYQTGNIGEWPNR